MVSRLAWKPWHEVVQLRNELKTGELSLSIFAADLYDVVMGQARPIYQDPYDFFSFTYPTFNLRELAKDVALRLAGQNDKAVRQLELTYGGGKTHTLITLYHLAHQPSQLPDLPAVQEFRNTSGMPTPQARIAVLAYQLAGRDGLRLLHAEGQDAEHESAPAENLLVELLSLPARQGLATLVLIDEVLMYAREKVGLDPSWRGRLLDFFQYLTQAATKVPTCAIVASLLATDPHKSDTLGRELTQELYAIFRREREQGVQPVLKEDVAETDEYEGKKQEWTSIRLGILSTGEPFLNSTAMQCFIIRDLLRSSRKSWIRELTDLLIFWYRKLRFHFSILKQP